MFNVLKDEKWFHGKKIKKKCTKDNILVKKKKKKKEYPKQMRT